MLLSQTAYRDKRGLFPHLREPLRTPEASNTALNTFAARCRCICARLDHHHRGAKKSAAISSNAVPEASDVSTGSRRCEMSPRSCLYDSRRQTYGPRRLRHEILPTRRLVGMSGACVDRPHSCREADTRSRRSAQHLVHHSIQHVPTGVDQHAPTPPGRLRGLSRQQAGLLGCEGHVLAARTHPTRLTLDLDDQLIQLNVLCITGNRSAVP